MIGYLEGKIIAKREDGLVLLAGGVGYTTRVGGLAFNQLKLGDQATLYIHTYVRDGAWELYGFATQTELELFEMLLGVSGVGPKTALNVVELGVSKVKEAVYKGDVMPFNQIPRLGRKNAQKIIIELKPKLGSRSELQLDTVAQEDLVEALIAMGLSREEAYRASIDIPSELSLAERVKLSLKSKQ